MTTKNRMGRIGPAIPLSWLTVKVTLWITLGLLALGLRLFRLDAAPLNLDEAQQALAAWRFLNSQGAPRNLVYSPLLFSGQWFTFLLLGASDFYARLLPALAGTALVLTPALLRRQLGHIGALATGLLLALSPTALSLSRTGSGDVLVALGALLAGAGLWRYLADHRPPATDGVDSINATDAIDATDTINTIYDRSPLIAAFGLGLMLVSSPLAYSALIALAVALLLLYFTDETSKEHLRRTWTLWRTTPNLSTYSVGILGGSVVLLSTAFAWHLDGLGATAALFPEWLRGFVRWPDSLSLGYPLLILILYEPLILFSGATGITLVALRSSYAISGEQINHSSALARFLSFWSAAALILALLRPGHGPGDVLLILVPLTCLSGQTLDRLVSRLRHKGSWVNEGLYLLLSVPLWAYLAINLAIYANRPGEYTRINLLLVDFGLSTYFSLTLISLLLLVVMAVVLGLVQGPGPTLRGIGLSVTLALSVFTLATTWGVSQNRPHDPRELLVLEPTAPEVRLLQESLTRLSYERGKGAHGLELSLLTDDPALVWALRDFRPRDAAENNTETSPATAVIALRELGPPPLDEDYVGQSFPLRRRWQPDTLACRWYISPFGSDPGRQLDCGALAKWLVFRHSPEPPAEEQIVLWTRQELLEANQTD